MVIKFSTEPDEIFFIECSKETGVAVKSFSQMKHSIAHLYNKMVLRHIEWSRPESALQILTQFVNETEDCHYDASMGKLLRKQKTVLVNSEPEERFSVLNRDEVAATTLENIRFNTEVVGVDKPRLVQKGKGFFSSELVIKALKCVGLI